MELVSSVALCARSPRRERCSSNSSNEVRTLISVLVLRVASAVTEAEASTSIVIVPDVEVEGPLPSEG